MYRAVSRATSVPSSVPTVVAPPGLAIATVAATGPGDAVRVVVQTRGRPLSALAVCDLEAITCARAQRTGRRRWEAQLPACAVRIGVIGRVGADYVFTATP